MTISSMKCRDFYLLFLFSFISFNISIAQFSIENCDTINYVITESCEADVILENRILSNIGSSETFKVDIQIDLWGDGTVDYVFRTDTIGTDNEIYQAVIESNELLQLQLPQNVFLSCYDHYVYWEFINILDGTRYECDQVFRTILPLLDPITDTLVLEVNSWGSDFEISLSDLALNSISDPFHLCYSSTNSSISFASDTYLSTIDFRDGLLDYECGFWPNIYYNKLYITRGPSCSDQLDSIWLRVEYRNFGADPAPNKAGSISTLMGNEFNRIESEHENCDYNFNFFAFGSSEYCKLWYWPLLDDFNDGLDTFVFRKIDTTLLGLTSRDILLMRDYILNGNQISDGFTFAGDVSNSGGVSTLDQVLLTKMILMQDEFDYDTPWFFELDSSNSPGFETGNAINQFYVDVDSTTTIWGEDNFVFTAYKKGDLDGSYTMDPGIFNATCENTGYDSIAVQLDDVGISVGQEFSIPIILNQDADIKGIHYGLSSDLVENISVTSGVLTITTDMYNAVDSNFVAIWMQNDLSSYDYIRGEVLFTLTMTAKEDFQLYELFRNTPEFPREVYLNDDYETHVMDFGDYGLSSSEVLASDLGLDIYPNPFNDELFIQLGGEALHNVKIQMFEIDGRLIKEMKLERSQANQLIPIKKLDATSGIKIIKVRSDEGIYTEKLISL